MSRRESRRRLRPKSRILVQFCYQSIAQTKLYSYVSFKSSAIGAYGRKRQNKSSQKPYRSLRGNTARAFKIRSRSRRHPRRSSNSRSKAHDLAVVRRCTEFIAMARYSRCEIYTFWAQNWISKTEHSQRLKLGRYV